MSTPRLVGALFAALMLERAAWALLPGVIAPSVHITIPPDPTAGAERLRQAMISVHAFVEKRRTPLRPLLRNVETPPMKDAARVIAGSPEALAAPAGMLAIVRLATHARTDADAVAAIDILLGEQKRRALFTWLDTHPPALGDCDPFPERHVAEGLRLVIGSGQPASPLAMVGACTDFIPASHVDSPPNSNDVSISIVADAGRSIADARGKLDPRSWAGCSTLWEETYLVVTANGEPEFEDDGTTPKKKLLSQAPGESFQNEMLYEHVQCDGKCTLKMLLDVTATKASNDKTYTVQFNLLKQLGGSPTLAGDDGHVKAEKNGNGVFVESVKKLGFTQPADADLVYAILQSIDVTAHLQRVVCCP